MKPIKVMRYAGHPGVIETGGLWTPNNLPTEMKPMNWFDAKLSSWANVGDGYKTWQNLGSNGGRSNGSLGPPDIQPNGMMGRSNSDPWSITLPDTSNFVPTSITAYYMASIFIPTSDTEAIIVRQGPGTIGTTPQIGIRPTWTSQHNNYASDLYGAAGSITMNSPNIIVATYGGNVTAPDNKKTHVNGELDAYNSLNNASAGSGSNRIGAYSSSNAPLKGAVGTVVTGRGPLSTSDRQKLEGYLAWQWAELGAIDRLPANHPYKNAPPSYTPA